MRDLRRRTITALVYAAVVVLAAFAPPVVFWILLALGAVAGLSELLALRTGPPSLVFALIFFVGLACLGALRALGAVGARHGTPLDLPVWLILAVLATWAADVVGYLIGSAFGRHRLAPRISPGKTWEGTIAGFVAAAIVSYLVAAAFGLGPRTPVAVVIVGVGAVGLAGDLLESYVKRRAGVKDSGTILPGHGGVLDRLDSLVAVAAFVMLVLVGAGLSQLGGEGGLFDRF